MIADIAIQAGLVAYVIIAVLYDRRRRRLQRVEQKRARA